MNVDISKLRDFSKRAQIAAFYAIMSCESERADSYKYSQQLFFVVSYSILYISDYLPHIELRNHSIQIVGITNFVVISNVGIKRFDCI